MLWLRDEDDEWRSRLVLYDFGLVWQHASRVERIVLVAVEPSPFDRWWDAFLAAYTEHLCAEATLAAQAWVRAPGRYLTQRRMVPPRFPGERDEAIATTPEAFAAHGIWFPARELVVV